MKTRNVTQWWHRRSKAEKTGIVAVGGVAAVVVTVAVAKAIVDTGVIVVSGKTAIACGKVAVVVANNFRTG